jgi:hypothetical protein
MQWKPWTRQVPTDQLEANLIRGQFSTLPQVAPPLLTSLIFTIPTTNTPNINFAVPTLIISALNLEAACSSNFISQLPECMISRPMSSTSSSSSAAALKGKVRKWGPFRHFSHMAFCTLTPKEFLHSSLEALQAERRQRPQLAKEGTMNEFCWQSSNSHRLLGHGTDSFTSPPKEGMLRITRVWNRELGNQRPAC